MQSLPFDRIPDFPMMTLQSQTTCPIARTVRPQESIEVNPEASEQREDCSRAPCPCSLVAATQVAARLLHGRPHLFAAQLAIGGVTACLAALMGCGREQPGFQISPGPDERGATKRASLEDGRPLDAWTEPIVREPVAPSLPARQPEPPRNKEPSEQPSPQPSEPPLPPPDFRFVLGQGQSESTYTSCAWVTVSQVALPTRQHVTADESSGRSTYFLGCNKGRHLSQEGKVVLLPALQCLDVSLLVMTFAQQNDADGLAHDGSVFERVPLAAYWQHRLTASSGQADRERFVLLSPNMPEPASHTTIGYEDFRGPYDRSDKDHNDLVLNIHAPKPSQSGAPSLRIPHLIDTCYL